MGMSSDAPVHIVSHDPDWPTKFEAERKLLIDAIGRWLLAGSIEHIGSTAIPGLAAKPVIDIMPGALPVLLRSVSNRGDALVL
jgi:GrpB-like predicted nucleotidyltransferase (UPF0157 family)